jgi:hypothetical protein
MNLIVSILITWSVCLWALPVEGNEGFRSTKESQSIALSLKPPLTSGNSIKLGYEIPYSGYVEFYLYDVTGTKIWADYAVQDKGLHYQSLRMDKLKSGQQYLYEFWYKGIPYPGKFSI